MSNKILLIITGSIAAYKAIDLIRLWQKNGCEIEVIMTKAAQEFVKPLLVGSILGKKIHDDLFDADSEMEMGHIALSRQNDLIIEAPASADFMAKMAGGIADDLALATILAANKKIALAPAMNEKMWNDSATQKNLERLQDDGHYIFWPKIDVLACGEHGMGKMVDPEEIFSWSQNFLGSKQDLVGKKFIVSAGGTYAKIDPVRFIGNFSSGKQGVCIAEELFLRGAEVVLVAANINMPINLPGKNIIHVSENDEMLAVIEKNLPGCYGFISAAAVADFVPKNFVSGKIKKEKGQDMILELEENIDILKTIANSLQRPELVIGFAAESDDLLANAQKKVVSKNCDFILANNISGGAVFGSDENKISVVDRDGLVEEWPKMSKRYNASLIAELVIPKFIFKKGKY